MDSVLTSGEVQQLLSAHGASLAAAPEEAPLDSLVPGLPDDGSLYGLPGGSGEGCDAVSPVSCSLSQLGHI